MSRFAEVVFWEAGRLRPGGRIDMTRSGLEGFGRSLSKEDEVVVEATGNAMAVVRLLSPYVARVIVANPLQVKAIAHAHVKTDKIDAGVLASLRAAGFLPEVWLPDVDTELRRRLVVLGGQAVHQPELVDVNGYATRLVAYAKVVEGVESIGADLDARANLAELRRRLEDDAALPLAAQACRQGQPSDAASRDDERQAVHNGTPYCYTQQTAFCAIWSRLSHS